MGIEISTTFYFEDLETEEDAGWIALRLAEMVEEMQPPGQLIEWEYYED
jgi:hypothetical protein